MLFRQLTHSDRDSEVQRFESQSIAMKAGYRIARILGGPVSVNHNDDGGLLMHVASVSAGNMESNNISLGQCT